MKRSFFQGRTRRALFAYSLGVLVLVAGIVLAAAGLETAVAHPRGHLETWAAWLLVSGVAAYLLGLGLFRRLLHLPGSWVRPVAAIPVLTCVALGLWVNGAAEIAAVTVILATTIALDTRLNGRNAGLRGGAAS